MGFFFGGLMAGFYGLYCYRVGMAFHLGAQGLYLFVNLLGAVVWQYQYVFRKPQSLQSLPHWHDTLLTIVLIFGTGIVAHNLIASGDTQESLRPFTLIGGCVGTLMITFEFRERWWVWMQVCSIATVLWFMYYLQTGYGIPGIVAWLVALFSVVICHCTHRK